MDLPKPMICRKMMRRFFEVKSDDINDFKFNWLPDVWVWITSIIIHLKRLSKQIYLKVISTLSIEQRNKMKTLKEFQFYLW